MRYDFGCYYCIAFVLTFDTVAVASSLHFRETMNETTGYC